MATRNNITITKNHIKGIIKEAIELIEFSTSDIEVEFDENTTLYVDIETFSYDGYDQIELSNLLLVREANKGTQVYENISDFIALEIDKSIKRINQDAKIAAQEWDYQKDYETIGGKYAYN